MHTPAPNRLVLLDAVWTRCIERPALAVQPSPINCSLDETGRSRSRVVVPGQVGCRRFARKPAGFSFWFAERRSPRGHRALSDNGPAYLSRELREYLGDWKMAHTGGAPYHPQTQGKIERYHRTMKNVVKLQHDYFPWELEAALRNFAADYNNKRYHESIGHLTPAELMARGRPADVGSASRSTLRRERF